MAVVGPFPTHQSFGLFILHHLGLQTMEGMLFSVHYYITGKNVHDKILVNLL